MRGGRDHLRTDVEEDRRKNALKVERVDKNLWDSKVVDFRKPPQSRPLQKACENDEVLGRRLAS